MRRTTTRLVIPACALATAALALTGCSSGSSGGSSAASSGSASTSASQGSQAAPSSPLSVTGSSTTGGSTGSGTGTGGSTVTTHAAKGTAACTSAQLTVSQKDASVGAGQYYSKLVFTNTSGTACTLTGYPGVSYVKANGVQSGNAAARSSGTVTTVTLAAHGTAYSVLHDTNGAGGYDPQQCQLTAVKGLRVYPPNRKAALFLPWNTEHCAGPTIHSFTIGPVQG